MKKKSTIMNYSLLAGVIGAMIFSQSTEAGIRIGNASRSYADSYNQVNAMQQQYEQQRTGTSTNTLPITVTDATLAEQIKNGSATASANMAQLERCAAIYPNGEFAWDKPQIGKGAGGAKTCVAVVELRGYQMGENGSDLMIARANLAAGDMINCNISEFPESTYNQTTNIEVELPGDEAPTLEDVKAAMNQEQKQNAGIKIAAGVLLSGLAGNMLAESEDGSDALIGGGKSKLQATAIGGLAGGAIMAGQSFGGKVGGDIIASTAINATSGALMGNMAGAGSSVLRIEKCTVNDSETSCLFGKVLTGSDLATDETAFYSIANGKYILCSQTTSNDTFSSCNTNAYLTSVKLEVDPTQLLEENPTEIKTKAANSNEKYFYNPTDSTVSKVQTEMDSDYGALVKIASAKKSEGQAKLAMIANFQEKAFGTKNEDWIKWRKDNRNNKSVKVYLRDIYGNSAGIAEGYTLDDFVPSTIDAEDGSLVDLDNKARLKGTLTGAGAGGALGALSAYQGAMDEISARWVVEGENYKNSLLKFYCVTGDRLLGTYNSPIMIPAMAEPENETSN